MNCLPNGGMMNNQSTYKACLNEDIVTDGRIVPVIIPLLTHHQSNLWVFLSSPIKLGVYKSKLFIYNVFLI